MTVQDALSKYCIPTMRPRTLLIAAIPLALVVFVLLFLNMGPTSLAKLPVLPSVATTPGEYYLDAERFVEIRTRSGTIRLAEGTFPATTGKSPQIVTYSTSEVTTLHPGWSVGIRPPDTLVINDGKGNTITRDFGDPLARTTPPIDPSGITRTPSAPSSAMARIIAGSGEEEPTFVPIPEVETPSEGPETDEKKE